MKKNYKIKKRLRRSLEKRFEKYKILAEDLGYYLVIPFYSSYHFGKCDLYKIDIDIDESGTYSYLVISDLYKVPLTKIMIFLENLNKIKAFL